MILKMAPAALLLLIQAVACAEPQGVLSLEPRYEVLDVAPARDTTSAVKLTLYYENNGGFAKPFDSSDRHYTAGPGASLSWRAPWVDDLLSKVPSLGGEFDGGSARYAMGFVGALTMYTPENIGNPNPIFNDRPYAGFTYGGLYFQRSHGQPEPRYVDGYADFGTLFRPESYAAAESLEVDVGILGPSSLAQNAQEMIHHFYDYTYPLGWKNQIHDEPEFSIKYNRKWRSPWLLLCENGVGADVLPDVGVTVGSLMNEAHAGTMFRLGLNLPDDFGPGEMRQPADFTRSPVPAGNPFENFWGNQSLYVFARPYGRLVAHNALLQGDNWRHDDVVTATPSPAVFGVQYGFAHRFLKYFEFDYVVSSESPEFRGQRGWDTWASVQFSFSYAW